MDTYIWFVPHELCLCYWRVRYLSLTCLFGNDSIDTFWVWVFTVFGSGHMKALVSKSAKWLTLCTTQKIVECQTSSYIILYNLNSYVLTQTIILCTLSGHFKFKIALFSFKSLYNKFFSNNHLQTIFRCRLSSHFSAQSKIKLKHCLWAVSPSNLMKFSPQSLSPWIINISAHGDIQDLWLQIEIYFSCISVIVVLKVFS